MVERFDEVKCFHCGKSFRIPDRGQWHYRQNVYDGNPRTKFFCSWKCLKTWRLKRAEVLQANKKRTK